MMHIVASEWPEIPFLDLHVGYKDVFFIKLYYDVLFMLVSISFFNFSMEKKRKMNK